MTARTQSIAESFLEYFNISYAADELQRDDVGRIRYRVYCEEFNYEDAEVFPDKIEKDAFDKRSVHCLITHKSKNVPAGCVRLVLTNGDEQLPFEKFCAGSLDTQYFETNPIDRQKLCEISRLAVDPAFRRRSGEKATRFGGLNDLDFSEKEQRTFPLIAVSSYLAATALGELSGCTAAIAMMEPFLPKLLSRSGVNVERVGLDVDYHGLRAPYIVTLDETLYKMLPELKELYCEIHDILSSQYMDRGF
jgi:N-acyl amino acid synthase of PEP-CTERM/exosortase system